MERDTQLAQQRREAIELKKEEQIRKIEKIRKIQELDKFESIIEFVEGPFGYFRRDKDSILDDRKVKRAKIETDKNSLKNINECNCNDGCLDQLDRDNDRGMPFPCLHQIICTNYPNFYKQNKKEIFSEISDGKYKNYSEFLQYKESVTLKEKMLVEQLEINK